MLKSALKFAIPTAVVASAALGAAIASNDADSQGSTLTTERGFVIHSVESAPAPTKEVLEWYQDTFQFVPHLAGVMAESPALSRSYWQLQLELQQNGTLSPAEDNVIQMSIALENECQYCVAGHTMAAGMFFGSSPEEVQALRTASDLPDEKLNALRDFSFAVYEKQGRVSESEIQAFYAAGYTRKQALDVVANIAAKVMSNYTNQIALTPIDEPLKPLSEGLPFQEDRKLISNP